MTKRERLLKLNSLMESKHDLLEQAQRELRIGYIDEAKVTFNEACQIQLAIEDFLSIEEFLSTL